MNTQKTDKGNDKLIPFREEKLNSIGFPFHARRKRKRQADSSSSSFISRKKEKKKKKKKKEKKKRTVCDYL